jgi:hypothetical protein
MASSVLLALTTKPNLSQTDRLQIVAADLTDALGRPLDGNNDGQPGGNYIATVSGSRVTADGIGLARTQRQPVAVADAIDVLLAHRELIRLYRSPRARNEARLEARVFDIHTGR